MNRPNILFVPFDDLRPQLGCYGHRQMITPNLDGLAESGVVFKKAYCQVPVCGASRASLLTGLRPTPSRFLDFATWAERDAGDAVTLPQFFREAGYTAVALGKVFHHAPDTADRSWSARPWVPERTCGWLDYKLSENQEVCSETTKGAPFECADVPDTAYGDGKIAEKAVSELRRLKDAKAPFFLATGLLKPHLPFTAPKRYWDYYKAEDVNLADNPYAPSNCPPEALHNFGELRSYHGVPQEGPLPEELAIRLVQGYYAATSYVDAQIGRILTALDELGLRENTIVVIWGDHGWQLGEHGLWCKHCNFDTSLHAPMIVRAPDGARDRSCKGIVEFLDVYPTLCELAGIAPPQHLHGTSFATLLADPAQPGKDAAYARYHAAESVLSGSHLFTEFRVPGRDKAPHMLYDHEADRDENVNIADDPANASTVARLSAMLEKHRAEFKKPGLT